MASMSSILSLGANTSCQLDDGLRETGAGVDKGVGGSLSGGYALRSVPGVAFGPKCTNASDLCLLLEVTCACFGRGLASMRKRSRR